MKTAALLIMLIFLTTLKSGGRKPMHLTEILNAPAPAALTYLALGDSYTIGESVARSQCFPHQLAAKLQENGVSVSAAPRIIARTGWTAEELQTALDAEKITERFNLVTLLIGVNNQFRRYSPDAYQKTFRLLLQRAVSLAGGIHRHVFVLSIPDWGSTPYGLESGRGRPVISSQIDQFNAINREETRKAGINYTNITPESRLALFDPSLVAPDGLHPSGLMYKHWVDALYAAVLKGLGYPHRHP